MSFEQFWSEFPKARRVNKVLAKAKWDAITSERGLSTRILDKSSGQFVEVHLKATPQEIMRALALYRWTQDAEYFHQPCTWLNRGLWLDYSEEELSAFEAERARTQAAVIRMQARRA